MANYSVHAPGYVVRPQRYGPDVFQNIDGIGWTDQQGYTQGWGTTFRGNANVSNWFHFPITTLLGWGAGDEREQCNQVLLYFDLQPNAILQAVNVWAGRNLFFQRGGLNVTGNYTNRAVAGENQFDFPDQPAGAMGISVLVRFAAVADVTFTGVRVALHD